MSAHEHATSERAVLLVMHTGRQAAGRSAYLVAGRLSAAGITVRMLDTETAELPCVPADPVESCETTGAAGARAGAGPASDATAGQVTAVPATPAAAEGVEMVLAFGGDGTLLRAAELARPAGAPLLGVNLGRIGFLAEAEQDDLAAIVDRVLSRHYDVETRMTIDVSVWRDHEEIATTWALNEASVEKASRARMIEVVGEVDGRPLARWGCDGLVLATSTGSTGYAFSAGGPVVWPELEALMLVPISAHSLFRAPLLVSPQSVLAAELVGESRGVVWCDGRRRVDLPADARVEVRRGELPVRLAQLHRTTFTDRLVAKFGLSSGGWRGTPR